MKSVEPKPPLGTGAPTMTILNRLNVSAKEVVG